MSAFGQHQKFLPHVKKIPGTQGRDPESMKWNPESKMVLDSLTLGELNVFNAKGAMNQ